MSLIRKMQGRDIEKLIALFPEKPEAQFDNYYIEHLQEKRVVLVACEKDDDGQYSYFGYVTLLRESGYTQFWRRNIPEIVDLNVVEAARKQGIGSALIAACEDVAHEKGHTSIGISVEQSPDYADANRLYPKLGYKPDGFGITSHDNELHLVKKLV
jgi:GNAT superfamily N-acetyltransferase